MSEPVATFDQIHTILLQEWDPLRLKGTGDHVKAYEAYAKHAQAMLKERRSEKDLAAYLHEVATELTGSPDLSYQVSAQAASQLKALA